MRKPGAVVIGLCAVFVAERAAAASIVYELTRTMPCVLCDFGPGKGEPGKEIPFKTLIDGDLKGGDGGKGDKGGGDKGGGDNPKDFPDKGAPDVIAVTGWIEVALLGNLFFADDILGFSLTFNNSQQSMPLTISSAEGGGVSFSGKAALLAGDTGLSFFSPGVPKDVPEKGDGKIGLDPTPATPRVMFFGGDGPASNASYGFMGGSVIEFASYDILKAGGGSGERVHAGVNTVLFASRQGDGGDNGPITPPVTPAPAIPLPGALWLLLGGLGLLGLARRRRA